MNIDSFLLAFSQQQLVVRQRLSSLSLSNRLRRLGSRFQMNLRNGFGIWTYQTIQGTHVRILKLIVLSLGLILSVSGTQTKSKKNFKKCGTLRERNAWVCGYEFHRVVSFCYFAIIVLQSVYENGLKTRSPKLRNLNMTWT